MTSDSFDRWLLETIDGHRVGLITALSRHLMTIGHTAPGVIACVLIGLVLVIALRLWRAAGAACIAFLIAGETTNILKDLIERPRPPVSLAIVPAYGYSMPSSVSSTIGAATLAFFLTVVWRSPQQRKVVGIVLAATLVAIGLAMIYLGAHWATDVLAGWALGAMVGLLVGLAVRPKSKVRVPSA